VRFSSRLRWDAGTNRLSVLLGEKRLRGCEVLDLTESNPTRAGLGYPAALTALSDERSLLYEPAPAGLIEAREAVAAYYAERGHTVAPEQILLTTGTSESYSFGFKLLADPGDEVLVPRPSYPLFEFLAGLESVRVKQYPLAYDGGWSMDVDAVAEAVTSRTRAVVVVNPNNPTGSFLKRDEAGRLVELCARRELPLISDEVFSDYAFEPDPGRTTTLVDVDEGLTFCFSGLSKTAGLPQMKLGWIVVGGSPEERRRAVARLEWIADTYLSVSTPVQHAAARLLAAGRAVREQIGARTAGNLSTLRRALPAFPSCELLDVEGGWYATSRIPLTRSEEEWALALLDRAGVLVQPGFFYDFDSEAFLVLSLLTRPEVFREGVARMLSLLSVE
jgi:aspartate/methionine/tyrosine aminotransferase